MVPQAACAIQLYRANWWLIAAMAAAFLLGSWVCGFTVEPRSAAYSYGVPLVFAAVAWRNLALSGGAVRRTTFVIGTTAQVVLITAIMAPLTYVAAAADLPLQDAALHALDQALGLDWRAYLGFVDRHPWLGVVLSRGYQMIALPIFAIPLLLGLSGHVLHLNRFVLAFGVALAATTLISALVPAVAAYNHLGLTPADYPNLRPLADFDHMRHLPAVRDGAMRHLDVLKVTGIVTFPSFHAASCLLYAWALWPLRWLRPLSLGANGLMLASTPIDGGHYFVDVIAGLALAAAAIACAARLGRAALIRPAPVSFAGFAPAR